MAENHVIDYEDFQERLVTALRNAWQEVRQQRPNESFYVFGVETDSDATVLTPFCNTEEQFAAEHGQPEFPIEKWAVDQDAELYGAGADFTSELQDEVNCYVFEDHASDPDDAFDQRKVRLLGVFEKALAQLDSEGFFGAGADRHKIILMVDVVDADDDEWQYMVDAVNRLNPTESTAEYLQLLEEAMSEDE